MSSFGDYGWGERGPGAGPSAAPDAFSELRRISRELRVLSRTVEAAARPDAVGEGFDGSGAIRIVVDGGHRVRSVEVDASWSERLAPADLGRALLEAYGQAVIQLLVSASDALDEAEAGIDEAAVRREADEALESSRRHRYVAPEDVLDEVQSQLRQIEMMQRLDAGDPAGPGAGTGTAGSAASDRDVAVFGPGRFVEITLRSGQVAEVRVHLSRMPGGANRTLAQEALGAFRAAADHADASRRARSEA